jgi:hypothetical protein
MRLDSLTLVIPSKADVEREAVAQAWSDSGGRVERLDRFWEPPAHLDREGVRLYGNDTFCLVVAQKLDLRLVSPDERILAAVPDFLLRRRVRVVDLGALERFVFPVFVKPVVPKQFRAAVYASKADLESECHGLGQETAVVVSEVVRFEAEARAFALDSVIRTLAVYEGAANHDHAGPTSRNACFGHLTCPERAFWTLAFSMTGRGLSSKRMRPGAQGSTGAIRWPLQCASRLPRRRSNRRLDPT